MGVRFEHRPLVGMGATDRALLIIPDGDIRVGRERLDPAAASTPSQVDDAIVDAARQADVDVLVSVFCARAPDGQGTWELVEGLDDAEIDTITRHLVRSQLLTVRRLFLGGVAMHVRVDVGSREQQAYRHASTAVREEIERSVPELSGVERELAELDAWLLRHFVFFFSVSPGQLIQTTLGGNPQALVQRAERAAARRSRLSLAARAAII